MKMEKRVLLKRRHHYPQPHGAKTQEQNQHNEPGQRIDGFLFTFFSFMLQLQMRYSGGHRGTQRLLIGLATPHAPGQCSPLGGCEYRFSFHQARFNSATRRERERERERESVCGGEVT
jgi:hypothetical protein